MYLFLISGITFLIDWGSKLYVERNLFPEQSLPLIRNIFHITYVKNPGVLFGLFSHQSPLIIGLSGVIILSLIIFWKNILPRNVWFEISLGLLLGGILGNFWDRLRDGQVIDFLDVHFWPVFNLADLAICIGIGMLIWRIFRLEQLKRKKDI